VLHTLVGGRVSPRMTIHHRDMNLITPAHADTSQENNRRLPFVNPVHSGLRALYRAVVKKATQMEKLKGRMSRLNLRKVSRVINTPLRIKLCLLHSVCKKEVVLQFELSET